MRLQVTCDPMLLLMNCLAGPRQVFSVSSISRFAAPVGGGGGVFSATSRAVRCLKAMNKDADPTTTRCAHIIFPSGDGDRPFASLPCYAEDTYHVILLGYEVIMAGDTPQRTPGTGGASALAQDHLDAYRARSAI